jgi:lipid-A-disaccharide synthase
VRRLLPVLKEVVRRRPDWDFVILPARVSYETLFEETFRAEGERVWLWKGDRATLYGGSDVLAACSGTATLEAALCETPLVIIYKVGWLAAQLYKLLVKQKFVGMPNILAKAEVAPELLQDGCTPESILSYLDKWVGDPASWLAASEGLKVVRASLGEPGALERAADIILEEAAREAARRST